MLVPLIFGCFYASVLLYALAGGMALRYMKNADAALLQKAQGCARIGAALLLAVLAARWLLWTQLPLTNLTDVLMLMLLLYTLIEEALLRDKALKALASFYLPPAAVLALLNALAAPQYLLAPPRFLHGLPLVLHVGLAFSAYALFFLAAMTSAAYLVQARRLKERRTDRLFYHLPSLEQLDQSLMKLIAWGYLFFLITLCLGAGWAWMDRALLGPHWWLSPKIVLSVLMALFYALLFHQRKRAGMGGKRRALLILASFLLLLCGYLALSLIGLRTWSFWGGAL